MVTFSIGAIVPRLTTKRIDHFTIKTTTQEQPNEETQRVRPGEVLNTEFLCVAPMESECVTLLAHP